MGDMKTKVYHQNAMQPSPDKLTAASNEAGGEVGFI